MGRHVQKTPFYALWLTKLIRKISGKHRKNLLFQGPRAKNIVQGSVLLKRASNPRAEGGNRSATVPELPSGCRVRCCFVVLMFQPPSPTPPLYSHFVRRVELRLAYRLAFVIKLYQIISICIEVDQITSKNLSNCIE